MTVNEYIQENYRYLKSEMYNITNGENKHLFEDFYHDCLEIFLKHKKAQQVVDNGTAKYFLIRIGLNNWRSKTSKFHYQYRQKLIELTDSIDLTSEEYDVTVDVMIDVVMKSLDEMYNLDEKSRYRAMIIVLYHSFGNNFSEVERQFEIPRTTVRELYTAGIKQLNEIIVNNITKLKNGEFRLSSNITEVDANWGSLFGSDSKQTLSIASRLFASGYFN